MILLRLLNEKLKEWISCQCKELNFKSLKIIKIGCSAMLTLQKQWSSPYIFEFNEGETIFYSRCRVKFTFFIKHLLSCVSLNWVGWKVNVFCSQSRLICIGKIFSLRLNCSSWKIQLYLSIEFAFQNMDALICKNTVLKNFARKRGRDMVWYKMDAEILITLSWK